MAIAIAARRQTWDMVPRAVLGVALLGAAALVWIFRVAYRGYEAAAAGFSSGLFTGGHEFANRSTSTFFVNVGTPKVFAMVVTPECTSAIVTGAFLVITAITVGATRVSARRALAAGACAAGLFVVANLLRLVLIAVASDQWGLGSGYHWSHVWAGTFVTVFGATLAVAVFLVVLGSGRRTGGPNVR